MKHSQKITLAKKMAKRTVAKGNSIFDSPAWRDRASARRKKELSKSKKNHETN